MIDFYEEQHFLMRTVSMSFRIRLLAGFSLLLLMPWPLVAQTPGKLGIFRFPDDLAQELGRKDRGALVYRVIEASPAAQAGLKPGDVVTQLNGRGVRDFGHLSRLLQGVPAGQKATITYERNGTANEVALTPALYVGDLTEPAYRASLDFLKSLAPPRPGPVLFRELTATRWEMGQRQEAVAELTQFLKERPSELGLAAYRLELLQKVGRFDEYTADASRLAEEHPESAELQLHKIEALLGTGRRADAAALAARLAKGPYPEDLRAEALRSWVLARIRDGEPMTDPALRSAAVERLWRRSDLAVAAYWRDALAGRRPYRLAAPHASTTVSLAKVSVLFGLVPNKMHGVAVKVNGVEVPLAIIDTGASHTLIGEGVAQSAAVAVGEDARTAFGSLSFTARPGFIRELAIGDLVLHDVPVSVGNPPPFLVTKAELALGIDVMHHVQFTLDYAANKVHVSPAQAAAKPDARETEVWDIPLWTFTDHTMTQAQTAKGGFARVLIDSGNFAQTLVWPIWARGNIADHPGPAGSMFVYALSNPRHKLRGLSIAGKTLPDWPVVDMPPFTLKGVDLLDVLMGHDLLSQYKVTIDLVQRRLRLQSPGSRFQNPVPPPAWGI